MKFIIEMRDGKPFGLPYELNNYKHAYPDFDYDSLPTETHAKYFFEPIPYDVEIKQWQYICRDDPLVIENGNVYERHTLKDVPDLERQIREQIESEEPPFKGWLIDTNSLIWIPPIPRPNDGNEYFWDNDTERWWKVGETPVPHIQGPMPYE